MSRHSEIAKLARRARRVGFIVEQKRRHLRFVAPDGEIQTIGVDAWKWQYGKRAYAMD